MKEYDKNIDQLTHDLLKSGMETPSPDLSARIMQRIAQEIPVLKKTYLLRPVSFPNFMHLFRWGGLPDMLELQCSLFSFY